MYLKGSKYSYNNRRRRSSPTRVFLLSVLVIFGLYFSLFVVEDITPPGTKTATPTIPPESFINEAVALEADGRISQAIEAYQKAIDTDPKNSSTYINIAKLQMFSGNYADALRNAENAILLNANNAVAHAIRGWALGKQKNYLDAQTAFDRAYEIDANLALTYAYQTEVLVDQINDGEDRLDTLDKATQLSRDALRLGTNLMESHRARGLLLEITGNYEEAITEFDKAITLNPNIADLFLALGRVNRAADLDSEAITAFERARSLNPYDPWAPYYISRTYSGNGEYAKAIQQAEDAIDLDPTETTFYWNLGTQYYRSENFVKAQEYFRLAIYGGTTADGQVIEAIPLSTAARVSELYYMYGILMARAGNCTEATKIVQQITGTVPDDATAMVNAEYMTEICLNQTFDIKLDGTLSTDGTEEAAEVDGTEEAVEVDATETVSASGEDASSGDLISNPNL